MVLIMAEWKLIKTIKKCGFNILFVWGVYYLKDKIIDKGIISYFYFLWCLSNIYIYIYIYGFALLIIISSSSSSVNNNYSFKCLIITENKMII